MKRLKYFFISIIGLIIFIPNVDAESLIFDSSSNVYYPNNYNVYLENKDNFQKQNNILVEYYNANYSTNYSYYVTKYDSFDNTYSGLTMFLTNSIDVISGGGKNVDTSKKYAYRALNLSPTLVLGIVDNEVVILKEDYNYYHYYFMYYEDYSIMQDFSFFYDSNFDVTYTKSLFYFDTIEVNNFYSNSSIIIQENDTIPILNDLLKYDSFEDYDNSYLYTEVNLDSYEYVILSLKDYTQTDSFETNMQVKGSVGITPVFNYGQAEKSEITDICNVSYSDFTDYRFFILKNDLINNAIYLVKSCEENSSFRFDSTIFDITYVTAENVDDPVVTIGGVEYHTIPFNQLSNTVNKNTEEGFVPGESEGFHPVESVVDYVTSFWSSLSTFMSLVTKFFNALPVEIRAIAITTFGTACTLGLLKILKS